MKLNNYDENMNTSRSYTVSTILIYNWIDHSDHAV
jgi:hypothetical protein